MAEGKKFELLSREGALVINNLLLTTILAIVLVGTLYPIVAEAMRGEDFGRPALLQPRRRAAGACSCAS